MRRQFVFSAIALLLMQMQLTICTASVVRKEDHLQSLVEDLRELISDTNNENDEYASRAGPGLTQAQKDAVVAKHNQLRSGEGAANMQKLKYNENLGRLAQNWADRCIWGHRPDDSYQATDYGFSSVGENLWGGTGDISQIPVGPIQKWFDEKPYYNYDSNTCSRTCGHYTQVTWASTKEVGCGLAKCATMQGSSMQNAYILVCNYGPAGNWQGERPFTRGAACSKCTTASSVCSNNLCDVPAKRKGKETELVDSLLDEMILKK